MFASGEGVLDILGALALATLTLTILVIVLALSGKGRLTVLVGSILLVSRGTMVCWGFLAGDAKDEWLICVLYGVVPIVSGCFGLFSLARSGKRRFRSLSSNQNQESPSGKG
jgi:hypothetical protein